MAQGGAGRKRRPRGAEALVQVGLRMPERTRQAANEAADALGISFAQYMQMLVERDQKVRQAGGTSAGGFTAA